MVYNSSRFKNIQKQRKILPIFKKRKQILYAVKKFRTIIIIGKTGSGKSTQIPQYLHEIGWTKNERTICCTQPRYISVPILAKRVAYEIGCKLGNIVGYAVRFEYIISKKTQIKYLTDA